MGASAEVVWDESLLAYDMGDDHPLNPVRLALTIRLATALGVLDGVLLRKPEPASDEEIERIHDAGYIAAVKAAPESRFDVGHGLGTADNPIFPGMHEASARVVGGSLLAADLIVQGTTDRAVSIAGGLHHAMPSHASGFCVYNDCAAAIARMLDAGIERVAYVDTDVHHGDGVQAAFYDEPRVLTISIHQDPRTLWPGTGYARELGIGDAEGQAALTPLQDSLDNFAAHCIPHCRLYVRRSVSLDQLVKGKFPTFPRFYEHWNKLLRIAVAHDASGVRSRVIHGLKNVH